MKPHSFHSPQLLPERLSRDCCSSPEEAKVVEGHTSSRESNSHASGVLLPVEQVLLQNIPPINVPVADWVLPCGRTHFSASRPSLRRMQQRTASLAGWPCLGCAGGKQEGRTR